MKKEKALTNEEEAKNRMFSKTWEYMKSLQSNKHKGTYTVGHRRAPEHKRNTYSYSNFKWCEASKDKLLINRRNGNLPDFQTKWNKKTKKNLPDNQRESTVATQRS